MLRIMILGFVAGFTGRFAYELRKRSQNNRPAQDGAEQKNS